MAESTPGSVHIAWYATGFRGDKFEVKLAEIAAVARPPTMPSSHRLSVNFALCLRRRRIRAAKAQG